jgi:hypothetical protein
MTDRYTARQQIYDAIQESADENLPEGSMLMGYVSIAEWMDGEGERWLSIVDSGANPDGQGLPQWVRQGYLHNALFDPNGFIPDYPEDEDDDE